MIYIITFILIIINILLLLYVYKQKKTILSLSSRLYNKIKENKEILFYDRLTKSYSYYRFVQLVNNQINKLYKKKKNGSMIMIDIKNLDRINNEYSFNVGNKILLKIYEIINEKKPKDVNIIVSRPGGSEFLIFISHFCKDDIIDYCKLISKDIKKLSERENLVINFKIGGAIIYGIKLSFKNLENLSSEALEKSNLNEYLICENVVDNVLK